MVNVINKRDAVGQYGTTVYASLARTATPDTQEFELGPGYLAGALVIDTTAAGVSPSTTFKVEGVDRASGKTYTVVQSAAVTGTGTVTLRFGLSFTAIANLTVNDAVPPVIRVTATHGNATSHTYTVGLLLS